jgi:hypothetical protein
LPGSQFHEARSLCQSRHAAKAATIPTAAPKATNNTIIIAMMATKVSVIEVRRCAMPARQRATLIGLEENTIALTDTIGKPPKG